MAKAHLLRKVRSETAFSQYFERGEKIGSGEIAAINEVVYRESGKVVAAIKSANWTGRDRRIEPYLRQEVISIFSNL